VRSPGVCATMNGNVTVWRLHRSEGGFAAEFVESLVSRTELDWFSPLVLRGAVPRQTVARKFAVPDNFSSPQ
jgi:hypothetical protein